MKNAAWTCPHCHQTVQPIEAEFEGRVRYIRRQYCPCPDGQADRDWDEAKAQQEYREQRVEQLLLKSGLLDDCYARYTFDNWDNTRHKGQAAVYRQTVEHYVQTVDDKGENWLYLYGPNGLGKTHLGIAALQQLTRDRLWKPHVVVWTSLCQRVKESWHADSGPTERDLWDLMRHAGVLLLDDLDKTSTSEWAMGHLYDVINWRSERQRPTIITANRSLSTLLNDWERSTRPHVKDTGCAVLSRIGGQLWGFVSFDGKDQRWTR